MKERIYFDDLNHPGVLYCGTQKAFERLLDEGGYPHLWTGPTADVGDAEQKGGVGYPEHDAWVLLFERCGTIGSEVMMTTYTLQGTPVDDINTDNPRQYFGCGHAFVAVDAAGVPQAILYEDREPDWPNYMPDELTVKAGGWAQVLYGMLSCWEFVSFGRAGG